MQCHVEKIRWDVICVSNLEHYSSSYYYAYPPKNMKKNIYTSKHIGSTLLIHDHTLNVYYMQYNSKHLRVIGEQSKDPCAHTATIPMGKTRDK